MGLWGAEFYGKRMSKDTGKLWDVKLVKIVNIHSETDESSELKN